MKKLLLIAAVAGDLIFAAVPRSHRPYYYRNWY